jgi:pyrophosphate--fructose-6-phosphate 1-phosphotransferase
MKEISVLQKHRAAYKPKLPPVFLHYGPFVSMRSCPTAATAEPLPAIRQLFPHSWNLPCVSFEDEEQRSLPPLKVGVVLSGGQAPGGHNVIAGIFDAIRAANGASQLFGFLGGPGGLVNNSYKLLGAEDIDAYRNTGGFDMIQSGRTKLEKEEQFRQAAANCQALGINAVVIIGGDDSNTNAASLAEYFLANGVPVQVIGVPKTIDGDLKNDRIEVSFGFDTATKVYTELLGNIQRDADSARKYWHFIRVMGRSASHIALECALQCHPNITIISEEVAAKGSTLMQIVEQCAAVIRDRASRGMNYGVAVIPEGLIEFIPEVKLLIRELNDLMAEHAEYFRKLATTEEKLHYLTTKLSAEPAKTFSTLPSAIQWQLLEDRDPHGNVQVSRIETEKLLIEMIGELLREWKDEGKYQGSFSPQAHFFGYEGRCAAPSNFDADYCYSLGYAAAALAVTGRTGYMAQVRNLAEPAANWEAGGVPLAGMMALERRHGKDVPVIRKCLVDTGGKPFLTFAAVRDSWARENYYQYPGPIQYFGPSEVCDRVNITLVLEKSETIVEIINHVKVLKESRFFSELTPEALTKLCSMVQRMPIKPGQIVIRKGDVGHCFYIVVDGELDVIGRDGKTVVNVLRRGDPFGEIALLEDMPRTADVVARTDGHLLFINTPDFKELLSDNTALLEQLEQLSKKRLAELEVKDQ